MVPMKMRAWLRNRPWRRESHNPHLEILENRLLPGNLLLGDVATDSILAPNQSLHLDPMHTALDSEQSLLLRSALLPAKASEVAADKVIIYQPQEGVSQDPNATLPGSALSQPKESNVFSAAKWTDAALPVPDNPLVTREVNYPTSQGEVAISSSHRHKSSSPMPVGTVSSAGQGVAAPRGQPKVSESTGRAALASPPAVKASSRVHTTPTPEQIQ